MVSSLRMEEMAIVGSIVRLNVRIWRALRKDMSGDGSTMGVKLEASSSRNLLLLIGSRGKFSGLCLLARP